MQILRNISALQQALTEKRLAGADIALVPTMGNIHAGHLALCARARREAAITVVSIFVNPTQFDRIDDFDNYPRTLDNDLALLRQQGVDMTWLPTTAELYPNGTRQPACAIDPGKLALDLEGAHRPGHFRGVATVVNKLFNAVAPEIAVFGEKDYQQLAIIRAMVAELLMPVRIVSEATIRENDGLALSSRNGRLSAQERKTAPELYATLSAAGERLQAGERDYQRLQDESTRRLEALGFRVDYVAIRQRDLAQPDISETNFVVLGAAWLGQTRLIDNLAVCT